jgi:hypothetical protein
LTLKAIWDGRSLVSLLSTRGASVDAGALALQLFTGGFNNCLSGPRGASGTIFVRTETVHRALYDAA